MACVSKFCAHTKLIHSERFRQVVGAVEKVAAKAETGSMLVLKDKDFDIFISELYSPVPVQVGDGAKTFGCGQLVICRRSERDKYKKPDGTYDPV